MSFDHQEFISPFTWRYGSTEMRHIWSEWRKRQLMRQVWLALAEAQHEAGFVTGEQLADLQNRAQDVDIKHSLALEKETHHDVVAELRTFAEQCPVGGGIIHWGATSADITDNVDVIRIREAAKLVLHRLEELLLNFVERIELTAALPVMAYSHIQPAEPTTLGYRLSVYAQDLLQNLLDLRALVRNLKGKGLKGAVGSQASFVEMLQGSGMTAAEMEARAMAALDLAYFPVTTQTYTRQQDLWLINALAAVAASLHKFALDFRIMQSPAIGEWAEPFAPNQVGSSAMPFKRNPIISENICSLARYVSAMPAVAWENAGQAILERTLDDSANRRLYLPGAFIACDEILIKARRLVAGMTIDETAVTRNMTRYGPFAATERLLMALVAAGADRQQAHEWIRQASLRAWQEVKDGRPNPLANYLSAEKQIRDRIAPEKIILLLDAGAYVGTAERRAVEFARHLQQQLTAAESFPAAG